jgi:CHAD domain-containing protein
VKLQAGPGFHLPNLEDLADGVHAGPLSERRLDAIYWDTADLRLARWGVTLRHREPEGWTLKLPEQAGGVVLSRTELVFEGSPRTVPEAASRIVLAYVRGARLTPVARLSSRRRTIPLLDLAGELLAEIVDDEVSVLERRRVKARFREVEIELGPHAETVLPALLERFRTAGTEPAAVPKVIRALGADALRPPEVVPLELGRRPTVAEVVRHALAAAATLVFRHDPGVRLGSDPEHVHQARVGARRLRSHLRTFRNVLDREWADSLRIELAWLAGELGAVRDQEVLRDRLLGYTERLPDTDRDALRRVDEALRSGVEGARAELTEAMDSQRYLDLLERLIEAANNPALQEAGAKPARRLLPALARKPWRALRGAVVALPDEPPDEMLHRCRILAKRARYAAEAVAAAHNAGARRFARAAAGLQDVLGELQDSVTAQQWLRARAGARSSSYVAGELGGLELVRAEAARGAWREAWERLDRKKLRAWMR